MTSALRARLDVALPREVAVGRGTELLVAGRCEPASAALRLELDGVPQPLRANGATFEGFVGVPAVDREHGAIVSLHGRREDGRIAWEPLGEVRLLPGGPRPGPPPVPPLPARPPADRRPTLAVCLATHNPPERLLARQLESLRDQRDVDWLVIVGDDASRPAARERLRAECARDERFHLVEHAERAGFYGNFERTLAQVPPWAEYVALCDQDDRWSPHKLARLVRQLEDTGAQLAYGDMRVVDVSGAELSPTFWTSRHNQHRSLAAMLVANSVPGAGCVFRRSLLDVALPFPPPLPGLFHDHWLACCALASGRIAYVDEPLQDYVQHDASAFGHQATMAARAPRGWVPGRHVPPQVTTRTELLARILARRVRSARWTRRVALRSAGRPAVAGAALAWTLRPRPAAAWRAGG